MRSKEDREREQDENAELERSRACLLLEEARAQALAEGTWRRIERMRKLALAGSEPSRASAEAMLPQAGGQAHGVSPPPLSLPPACGVRDLSVVTKLGDSPAKAGAATEQATEAVSPRAFVSELEEHCRQCLSQEPFLPLHHATAGSSPDPGSDEADFEREWGDAAADLESLIVGCSWEELGLPVEDSLNDGSDTLATPLQRHEAPRPRVPGALLQVQRPELHPTTPIPPQPPPTRHDVTITAHAQDRNGATPAGVRAYISHELSELKLELASIAEDLQTPVVKDTQSGAGGWVDTAETDHGGEARGGSREGNPPAQLGPDLIASPGTPRRNLLKICFADGDSDIDAPPQPLDAVNAPGDVHDGALIHTDAAHVDAIDCAALKMHRQTPAALPPRAPLAGPGATHGSLPSSADSTISPSLPRTRPLPPSVHYLKQQVAQALRACGAGRGVDGVVVEVPGLLQDSVCSPAAVAPAAGMAGLTHGRGWRPGPIEAIL